jgi:hypothetical protein
MKVFYLVVELDDEESIEVVELLGAGAGAAGLVNPE